MVTKRLWRLFAVVVLGLSVVWARLAWVQILSPDGGLPEKSRQRQYYSEVVEPFRGDIVSRDGVLLATDELTFDIEVHYAQLRSSPPRWLGDVSSAARSAGLGAGIAKRLAASGERRIPEWVFRLSRAAGVGVEEIMSSRNAAIKRVERVKEHVLDARPALRRIQGFRIKEETVHHVILANVPFAAAARIKARPQAYGELRVGMKRRRVYPRGRLACHVIGRLGEVERGDEPDPPPGVAAPPDKEYLPGDDYGILGVEKQYDWSLRGSRGMRWLKRRPSPLPDVLDRERPARPGDTLVLALDARAQEVAESALSGQTGAVFVMDAENGEVLVSASSPGYDLNLSGSELAARFDERPGPFLNRGVRDAVAGGSVVKVASAVAAVETGSVDPRETIICDSVYRIGQWEFTCHVPHGRVGLSEAIEHSCNVYFFTFARETGPLALAQWARRLGLGVRTGIDLPYEGSGRFPDPQWLKARHGREWYPGDTLNACIGQGDVQITPAQATVMMAAIANGGFVLQPRLALAGNDSNKGSPLDGSSPPVPAKKVKLDPVGLRELRKGMEAVVKTGTARRVPGLAELGVAGKTGTAETHDPAINHGWFAGYVPSSRPRYAFAVAVHRTPLGGADAAGPIARDVLRELLERSLE